MSSQPLYLLWIRMGEQGNMGEGLVIGKLISLGALDGSIQHKDVAKSFAVEGTNTSGRDTKYPLC